MVERFVNYDNIANQYDCRYEVGDWTGVERQLREFVAGTDDDIVPEKILEVGCGTGHWLLQLENQGYRITGLDPARAVLDVAKKKVPQAILIQGKAEAMPWNKQTFDRVFCVNAFHHFSDKRAFITEARCILRPKGGIMTIGLDPHTGLDSWWIYDYFPQVLEIDRKRYPQTSVIRQMMCEQGFSGCCTIEAQHIPWQLPARTALEIGRLNKSYTSQLTVLTNDEYNQGINRLVKKLEATEATKDILTVSADLRLYATIGWMM